MVDERLEEAAVRYADREWDAILALVTSSIARGFMAGMKDKVVDILRRAYLAGAERRVRG